MKVKAVNEMMERIKHGVVLRPVKSQDSKVRTRRADREVLRVYFLRWFSLICIFIYITEAFFFLFIKTIDFHWKESKSHGHPEGICCAL